MNESGLGDGAIFREWDPGQDSQWDDFVNNHPHGTVYHHSAWSHAISQTFGYEPLYLGLLSSDGHRLAGILPFLFINGVISRKRLVSLPFASYCQPLIPQSRMDEAIRFAFKRFRRLDYVELKFLKAKNEMEGAPRLAVESPFVTQILSLAGDLEEIFFAFHSTSIRQRVRRAENEGLIFRAMAGESNLRRFFQLLAEFRREHGLPIQPYKFFANMQRFLAPKNLFELNVVELKGEIIAAAIVLKGKSTWHLEYSVSDSCFLKHGPNQFLIWECIKRAHKEKANFFDFGRTSVWHHSLLEFKDRWHTQRHPIYYRFFPVGTKPPQWKDHSSRYMLKLNKKLPLRFLEWEGRIIFPHRG